MLTEAGERYYREVAKALVQLREATAAVRARPEPVVRLTTTVTFASLWLVPRLADFQTHHADIPVHCVADDALRELERVSLDVAIRYCPASMAGPGAVRLFGELVTPVASPTLLKKRRVRTMEDLLVMPLLDRDDPKGAGSWLSWKAWCAAMGFAPPRRKGLSFSHYDQMMQAAVAGQGVALGRIPLINDFLEDRRLALALPGGQHAWTSDRAYWLVVAPGAAGRSEVKVFADWLTAEASRSAKAAGSRAGRMR